MTERNEQNLLQNTALTFKRKINTVNLNILSSMGMGEGVRTESFSTLFVFQKKNIFIMKNKMKQKYFYEIGKIYLYNLKKYLTII